MEIGRDELVVIMAFISAFIYYIWHRRRLHIFYFNKSEARRSQVEMELILTRKVIKKFEVKYGIKEVTSAYQESLQEFVEEMKVYDRKVNGRDANKTN